MTWRLAFRSDGLHSSIDGTATLMAEHDNQACAQNVDRVLDASQPFIVEHIARYSNDKQISETFIKDDFGWHTRIGTTEDDRKRVLTLRQFCASFGGLLASHSQGNYASIFIAVGRHVLSFINRLVRVLRISGGEPPVAFFQPRDRLSRGNNWLVGMSGICSAARLVADKQTEHNE